MPKKINQPIVGSEAIAEIFGVTSRRVQQLVAEGIITASKVKGVYKYNLYEAVKEYVKYFEDIHSNDTDSLEKQKLQAEVDYKRHKADIVELELAELESNMHRSEDVECFVGELLDAYKSQLLSLPGLLAPELIGMDSVAEISEKIRKEAHNMLESLAAHRYDTEKCRLTLC